MSSSRIPFPIVRRSVAAAALSSALASALSPALAAEPPSSAADRQRFIAVTRNLEEAPLNAGARDERAWALEWLTKTPDIDVTLCAEPLPRVATSKYRYRGEIVVQDAFSMGAFVLEHPEAARDPAATQLAGVEGALKAYRAILRQKPDARSPELDAVLQIQARGELPEFVRKAWISCSTKKSSAL